jgi:hypothetical protein
VRFARPILFLTMLLCTSRSEAEAFDFKRIDEPSLKAALQHVAWLGVRQFDNIEMAAFLVRRDDGAIACLLWPNRMWVSSARYDGAPPRGTVAIVHSHPPRSARPSAADVEQAKRGGLPSYVVTRWEIHVIDPSSGEDVTLLRLKNWMRNGSKSACRDDWWHEESAATTTQVPERH